MDARAIRETEAEMNRLHERCRSTFLDRQVSPAHRDEWRKAVEAFRHYQSPLWEFWSPSAQASIVEGSGYWRHAALLYLQMSPRFFRSGYLRDLVCHRLKQAQLLSPERKAIQRCLLDAVVRRPSTGRFTFDCRLAIRVCDAAFVEALDTLNRHQDAWTAGRAGRMKAAIARHATDHRD